MCLCVQDMHTLNLEPYQYGGTNITGIRVVDPNDSEVKLAVQEMNDISRNLTITPDSLKVINLSCIVSTFLPVTNELGGVSIS
jgi:hypothetical protein